MTDDDLFTLADLVATRLLEGQTDKHGRPLIHHSVSVYRRAKSMNLSVSQCIAAILHDVRCARRSKF